MTIAVTLANVASLLDATTAQNTINTNSNRIVTGFTAALDTGGDQMEGNLDMNSNRILNLPAPISNTEPVRLGDINLDTANVITFSQISGSLSGNQLPFPTASSPGGVESFAPQTNQWLTGITTGGVPTSSTINYSQIAGTPPTPTFNATVGSYTTLTAAIAATVQSSIDTVITTGYSTAQDGGGGMYTRLASTPGTIRNWHFQSADGTYWQLQTPVIYPRQVGAVLDGTTDDSVAIQAWVDYSATFGVSARDQAGTAAIPTETINLSGNTNVQGGNLLTIEKTSNTDAPLIYANTVNNVTFSGINVTTTSGFTSTSSNTIGLTSQTYTVPSGIVGLVVNNYVQISSQSQPANYMIAEIVSYTGTTLTVLGTTAVGSGTYTAWYIDVYPINGTLTPVNAGIKMTACDNIYIRDNVVMNRFYDAIDIRNCNNVYIEDNIVSGQVNRGIAVEAFGVLGDNTVITGNSVDGLSYSQYGIVTAATVSGAMARLRIGYNKVLNTIYQGISSGGAISNATIVGNTISCSGFGTTSGILIDLAGGLNPEFISVSANSVVGCEYGVYVVNGFYVCVTGNNVVGTSSHGYNVSGASGVTFTGNIAESCGGWGFNAASASSNTIIAGCMAISCSLGGYNISGAITAGNI